MRRGERGQSTVEFAVVAVVLIVVGLGLAALARHFVGGAAVGPAVDNAAYGLEASANAIRYILMF